MKVMKKKLLIILLLFPLISNAQKNDFNVSQIYPIERSHSFIGFSIKYMGFAKVRGRFENFSGSFRYDENDLSKTSVTLNINVISIDTDLNFRDRDLRSDQWFGVETYPNIRFTSTKAKKTKNGLLITGNLTVKKITKEVTLRLEKPSGVLKDIRGDHQVILSGSFSINRKDFGVQGDRWSKVKEGITAVANEVKIEFTALGKQILKENFANRVGRKGTSQELIYSIYKEESLQKAFAKFDELVSSSENKIRVSVLNTVGYMMLKEGAMNDAMKVFRKNIKQFPDNAGVYDSYAEALAADKQWVEAKRNFIIALEKNPNNMNAKEFLKHL
tara:strand:+ start:44423 stop:45412 length:990 start_codon:yes stop_codon:yes gene_type:complete